MAPRSCRALPALLPAVFLCSLFAGCSGPVFPVHPNARPVVTLTQAPVDTTEIDPDTGAPREYFYAYRLQWSGYDPDGRVDHFLWAVDPPTGARARAGEDTAWTRTQANEEVVFFRATRRDPHAPPSRPTASDLHVFVIKAVDQQGLASEPTTRAFFSYTVAPSVTIVSPRPSEFLAPSMPPNVRVSWTGTDPDGQFTQRPVRYKYRLYRTSPEDRALVQAAMLDPGAFRDSVVASGFAGYDSTTADTTWALLNDLTPTGPTDPPYLFVVVGFDEAGAYSPIFGFGTNLLLFSVGFANASAPVFRVWNAYVDYEYVSGGYSRPTDPNDRKVIRVQVPAGVPIDFRWVARSPVGATITGYRWVQSRKDSQVDLDDPTPRSDELLDKYHWSRWSNSTTSGNLGVLDAGSYWLYVEAVDANQSLSNAVVYMQVVQTTLRRDLLVVDDTRREFDFYAGGPRDTTIDPYTREWPSASELDTLLYARGGMRWRGLPAGREAVTPPGLLAGFDFDTVGTRRGVEDLAFSLTLAQLAPYRHVLWLVDADGATSESRSLLNPMTALRFFSRVFNGIGAANPLSSYIDAGGQVWLAGGGIAMASTQRWLKSPGTGYIGGIGQSFSSAPGRELAPGRFMVDAAGWSNEFVCSSVLSTIHRFEGPYRSDLHVRADRMPVQCRRRSEALDELPPLREGRPDAFYPSGGLAVEYISDRTRAVLEDTRGGHSVLDTLLVLEGGAIRTEAPENPEWVTPVMTYFHPSRRVPGADSDYGAVLMTGFAPWDLTRADARALVQFVLSDVWGLVPSSGSVRDWNAPLRSGAAVPATGRSALGRLPAPRRTR